MSSPRRTWLEKAFELAAMLHGERPEDRAWLLARFMQDVQDEMDAGAWNEAVQRSFAASDHSEGHSMRVPDPPSLRLVEPVTESCVTDRKGA